VALEEVASCSYRGATVTGPVLCGLVSLTDLRETRIERARATPGARMWQCSAAGSSWHAPDLQALTAHRCDLRGADLREGAVGTLVECDLHGARLHDVTVDALLGCDLQDAHVSGCDWSGADLRGTTLRDARLDDVELVGARVEGADFRGVKGLSAATRRSLIRAGAILTSPGWLALARALPGTRTALTRHRLARGAAVGVPALILPALGVSAALALTPPEAPAPSTQVRVTQVEQVDRERTKASLEALRAGINAAHETMRAAGARRTWPTLGEVQENAYDRDGDGPGDATLPLVPGGLPQNHVTASQGGVLPYCNDVPDQNTLTGVDTDWHYCPETGRVYASAGFTAEPTLDW
jgi:uncharacterized protein YjbI with pentapeptide repeats